MRTGEERQAGRRVISCMQNKRMSAWRGDKRERERKRQVPKSDSSERVLPRMAEDRRQVPVSHAQNKSMHFHFGSSQEVISGSKYTLYRTKESPTLNKKNWPQVMPI